MATDPDQSTDEFFAYRYDRRFRPWLAVIGVRPSRDGVALTADGNLRATFGVLRLVTPIGNIAGAHITAGYSWYKAVGPRLSLADDGVTFGTNADRGVCIHFVERVRPVLGFRPHSALTVTVADCEALLVAIERVST